MASSNKNPPMVKRLTVVRAGHAREKVKSIQMRLPRIRRDDTVTKGLF